MCRFLCFWDSILLPIANVQINSNVTENTTSQAIEGWNTYKDPEGKFSIQYPSFISITPKQNRFDTKELSFSTQNNSIAGDLLYTPPPESIATRTPQTLKAIVTATNKVLETLRDFRVVDTNDTLIDGNYAISQITYDKNSDGSEIGMWEVFALKDNQIFKFTYFTPTDIFDRGLPTVQKMLASLKILK